jgi:hypothetical protein
MQKFPTGTTGRVIKAYQQPYPDPIKVRAGDRVFPDAARESEWAGWVWCTDENGKGGWTPQAWLKQEGGGWRVTRDFDAIELTVHSGDVVIVELAESGFLWVKTTDGRWGWVPVSHVQLSDSTSAP